MGKSKHRIVCVFLGRVRGIMEEGFPKGRPGGSVESETCFSRGSDKQGEILNSQRVKFLAGKV